MLCGRSLTISRSKACAVVIALAHRCQGFCGACTAGTSGDSSRTLPGGSQALCAQV